MTILAQKYDGGSEGASRSCAPALLTALHGTRPERTPVWFMRQAGRSLPEYRALRERTGTSMLDACLEPALAAEITLQPVRRHGVDAAVFFSDIMVPLRLAGVDVRIEPGVGPVMESPVRTATDVAALTEHLLGEGRGADGRSNAEGLQAVREAVGLVVAELGSPEQVPQPGATSSTPLSERALAGLRESTGQAGWSPVLGFGGAPFTLAAYLVEGRPSRDHLAARSLMHSDPATWDTLMAWCAQVTGEFIAAQVEAGASAVQLFDSWAGSLSPADYREKVAPYSALAAQVAREAVSPTTGQQAPLIHFGTGTARVLADMRSVGAQAVGVDDRTDLHEAITLLAQSDAGACPVQGNLDPALLTAPWEVIEHALTDCLAAGRTAPGHVVNLGHGVPPGTDPDVLTRVVAKVHGSLAWEAVALAGWDAA